MTPLYAVGVFFSENVGDGEILTDLVVNVKVSGNSYEDDAGIVQW